MARVIRPFYPHICMVCAFCCKSLATLAARIPAEHLDLQVPSGWNHGRLEIELNGPS